MFKDVLHLEWLSNGYIEAYVRGLQTGGVYEPDGTPRGGNLAYGRARHEISKLVRGFAASGQRAANVEIRY
jgi:hypothetical protein